MSELTRSIAPVPSVSTASLKPPTFSLRQVLPWLVFAALLALVALYLVGAEEGAAAVFAGNAVHEWTHDGRHLLGFPCH